MDHSEGVRHSAYGYHGQRAAKLRPGSGPYPMGSVRLSDVPHRGKKVDSGTWRIVQPSESPESGTSYRGGESRHVRKNSDRRQRYKWSVRWRSTHSAVRLEVCVLMWNESSGRNGNSRLRRRNDLLRDGSNCFLSQSFESPSVFRSMK